MWVHGDLVLGGISDQALSVGEGDVRRSRAVSLVIGDDLHLSMHEDSHAGIGGSQIDTNGVVFRHISENPGKLGESNDENSKNSTKRREKRAENSNFLRTCSKNTKFRE